MDSVTDATADDLLRHLYDLTFRQPTSWGWGIAGVFAALPAWLAIVCMVEGNVIGSVVLVALAGTVPGLRYYLLRRKGYSVFGKIGMPANDG